MAMRSANSLSMISLGPALAALLRILCQTMAPPSKPCLTNDQLSLLSAQELFEECIDSNWQGRLRATRVGQFLATGAGGMTKGSAQVFRKYSLSLDVSVLPAAMEATIQRLPPSVMANILGRLPFTDRQAFAQTSRTARASFGVIMQHIISDRLQPYHLNFRLICLMQCATQAVVGGPFLLSLFQPLVASPITTKEIHVYCRPGDGLNIMRYFRMMTRFRMIVYRAQSRVPGISRTWRMGVANGPRYLTIMEGLTDNPSDAVMFSDNTALFAFWSQTEVWNGYPALAVRGISLTTPEHMPIHSSLAGHRRAWQALLWYRLRGFLMTHELPSPHICGVNKNCPATLRHTSDSGCLKIALPHLSFAAVDPLTRDTMWSLDGQGCSVQEVSGSYSQRPATHGAREPFVTTIDYAVLSLLFIQTQYG